MRGHAKTLVGLAVSAVLLWWALRDVSVAEVAREIRTADPLLLGLAATVATLGIPFRALRWRSLLVSPLPFQPRMAATAIGFAANNLLPARVGEIARAVYLHRLARVPLGGVIGSLVLERMFDALVLISALFAAMSAPDFPAATEVAGVDPRAAARWAALATAALVVLLFAVAIAPRFAVGAAERVFVWILPERVRLPAAQAMRAFVAGLAILRSPRRFAAAAVWTVAQWALLALSFLLGFRAFGIDAVSYGGAVFLQSLTGVAVAVPSSPGFFGPFEAAAKVGLALWDISAGRAVSFAIGFHLAGFVPVSLLGLWYFVRSGLRWSEVEREVEGNVVPEPLAPEGAHLGD